MPKYLVILTVVWGIASAALAMDAHGAQSSDASTQGTATPDQPVPVQAIPLGDVASEADAATETLLALSSDAHVRASLAAIARELPGLMRDIDLRARENQAVVAQRPPLDVLQQMDSRWREMQSRIDRHGSTLGDAVAALDRSLQRIDAYSARWSATLIMSHNERAPPEVIRRIEAVQADLFKSKQAVERQRSQALRLQTQVSNIDARIRDALRTNRGARDEALDRMFVLDKVLPGLLTSGGTPLASPSNWRESVEAQQSILTDYVKANRTRLGIHLAALVLLFSLFRVARRRLVELVDKEPELETPTSLVRRPFAAALVLTLMLTHWLYADPPRAMLALNGIAMFVPTILVLRRLVSRRFIAFLYLVLLLYFLDQARAISASVETLPHILFVGEMSAAAVIALLFASTLAGAPSRKTESPPSRSGHVIGIALSVLFACAAGAHVIGYVSLSYLIGNTLLHSIYAALTLYTAVQILDALVEIVARTHPLAALRMVRSHRALLRSRIRRLLQAFAAVAWILYEFQLLAIADKVFDAGRAVLETSVHLGQIELSVANILSFIAAIWAAFTVSRFIRFVLDEEVFPHASLSRGIPYAISRTLHFATIALGFVVAMGALGMQMTQLTILASAFSIGVGFGLQNIFNNFVSGLIVQRPPSHARSRAVRILVVDDNRDSAQSLSRLLDLLGHSVDTAYDGFEAIEKIRASLPDVVLLDIGMPGLSGYDTARRLRSEHAYPDLRLIALTGWGQDEDRRRSEDAGFDAHLVKPVDISTLMNLLARWCSVV